ncbi:hypothetical protein HN51_054974 [Arachis hypogaea]
MEKIERTSQILSKRIQLLEVYAIEIQMYTETKNNKKLKAQAYAKLLVEEDIRIPAWFSFSCKNKTHVINGHQEKKDEDLLVLPTDVVLFEDSSFKVYAEKYAKDQVAFFNDYAEAHAKLSNLGAKFDPPEDQCKKSPWQMLIK